MIKAVKVQLRPSREQEKQLWISAGAARLAYNWALAREKESFESSGEFLNEQVLRKEFTQRKQSDEYKWLYGISNHIIRQGIKDACDAYKRFFKGTGIFPRFRSKKHTTPGFCNDSTKLKFKDGCFLIEKVGWVPISKAERITADKFQNPQISFDGRYWYISVGLDTSERRG